MDGDGKGRGVGMEDLSFRTVFRLTQAHVQSVTLHMLLGLLMFCMDHPVTIVCKQCGEGRRYEADSEERLRKYIYLYMYIDKYKYKYEV